MFMPWKFATCTLPDKSSTRWSAFFTYSNTGQCIGYNKKMPYIKILLFGLYFSPVLFLKQVHVDDRSSTVRIMKTNDSSQAALATARQTALIPPNTPLTIWIFRHCPPWKVRIDEWGGPRVLSSAVTAHIRTGKCYLCWPARCRR